MGKLTGHQCTYYKIFGCKVCKYINYKQCPNFIKAHNTTLLQSILPIENISEGKTINYRNPIYSRDAGLLLKALAKHAILSNKKVTKYNLNQSITLGLDYPETLTGQLVYLELKGRVTEDKIIQVVMSFIDKLTLNNCQVFILSAIPSLPIQSNFQKL